MKTVLKQTHSSNQEKTSRFKGNFSFSFQFWFLISYKKCAFEVDLSCLWWLKSDVDVFDFSTKTEWKVQYYSR